MLEKIKLALRKIKDIILFPFLFVYSYFAGIYNYFTEKGMYLVPSIGDIVYFEDGTSTMIVHVSEDESGKLDIRYIKGPVKCVNPRGRQKSVIEVSKAPESWPPKDAMVFSNGDLVYPQNSWKIKFAVWFNKKLF